MTAFLDSTVLQDNAYDFDQMGRLIRRTEFETGTSTREEVFSYDFLNRVTAREYTVGGAGSPTFAPVASYDVYGNITSHAEQPGAMAYTDSARPHRLTAVAGSPVHYGDNGNISWKYQWSQAEWVYHSWGANRKLATVSGATSGDSVSFVYDGSDQLVTQYAHEGGHTVEKKLYLMGYEQKYRNVEGSSFDPLELDYTRIPIPTPTGVVGHFTWPGEFSGASPAPFAENRNFVHYDHQGSVVLVTDHAGQELSRYSYGVFGAARDSLTWARTDLHDTVVDQEDAADNGYTGHEMLDAFELIHMGGRVYDPQLGRFLSPDPFVQAPGHTQSYNRYRYGFNNPLSHTDPSGYIVQLIPLALYAAGAFGTVGSAAALTTLIVSSLVATFAGTLIMGGSLADALKATALAGASMALSFGIGELFNQGVMDALGGFAEAAKAAAHGIKAGGLTELAGGEFRSGFLSGFAGEFGNNWIDANMEFGPAAVVASAIVGGTASELGGGKFANGAVHNAFALIFNHRVHELEAQGRERRPILHTMVVTPGSAHPELIEDVEAWAEIGGMVIDELRSKAVDRLVAQPQIADAINKFADRSMSVEALLSDWVEVAKQINSTVAMGTVSAWSVSIYEEKTYIFGIIPSWKEMPPSYAQITSTYIGAQGRWFHNSYSGLIHDGHFQSRWKSISDAHYRSLYED